MSYRQTGKSIQIETKVHREYPEAEQVCDGCGAILGKHHVKNEIDQHASCTFYAAGDLMDQDNFQRHYNAPGGDFCSVRCLSEFARKHGLPEAPQA